MLIDTHCHLDAGEFDADRAGVVRMACAEGVRHIVVPAIAPANFEVVEGLAHAYPECSYALGIHPLLVERVGEGAIDSLAAALDARREDPRLVAVGEIGLDYFDGHPDGVCQERLFESQLRIAREHDLPVLLHVRRAQDRVLKYLRKVEVPGGIAHAFNGSEQQASNFVAMGFCLGFGGAMTFARARRIRHLAVTVADEALVLETDSPDIPPEWRPRERNDPAQLPRIAQALAQLRATDAADIAELTTRNASRVLPRLGALLAR